MCELLRGGAGHGGSGDIPGQGAVPRVQSQPSGGHLTISDITSPIQNTMNSHFSLLKIVSDIT